MPKDVSFKSLFSFSKPEVDDAFKKARLHRKTSGFTVLAAPADSGRMLIIIPRKVGKANKRNKLRRQLKAIFYEESLYELPFTFIVLVYKQAVDWTFDELKNLMLSFKELAKN